MVNHLLSFSNISLELRATKSKCVSCLFFYNKNLQNHFASHHYQQIIIQKTTLALFSTLSSINMLEE